MNFVGSTNTYEHLRQKLNLNLILEHASVEVDTSSEKILTNVCNYAACNLTTDADKIVLVTQSNNKFRFRFRALDGIKIKIKCHMFIFLYF